MIPKHFNIGAKRSLYSFLTFVFNEERDGNYNLNHLYLRGE